MGMPKLWGKDKDGNRGFLFSHVKTIYYNWASKILLSTKLDEMDALIDAKIAKAMMSNQQVNSTDKVPTSALAYAMSQNIAKNATDITAINGSFVGIQLDNDSNLDNVKQFANYFAPGGNSITNKPDGIGAFNLEVYRTAFGCIGQKVTASGNRGSNIFVREYNDNKWTLWEQLALKSDLGGLVVTEASSIDQINDSGHDTDPRLRIMYFYHHESGSYTTAYISIDVQWIRFQFKASNASILQQRTIYGQSIGTWRTLVLD